MIASKARRAGDVSPPIERRADPNRRLSLKKKLLFATATTLLFFGLIEAALTLCGIQPAAPARDPFVGFDGYLPLFVETPASDGRSRLTTAENKLPWFNRQQFPREKADGVYRIFCLGGSTTYGRPYDDTTSFCGWLRELLPEADSSRQWEVINAGGISYASYRVAAVMQELVAYQPDLFIVYTGHNEFLEERTYRDLRRLPAPLLAAAAFLSRSRTGAALSSLLDRPHSGQSAADDDSRYTLPAEVDAVLDRSFGPTDYRRDDALRPRVLEHFELNLARMADIARSAGAELLFVVPASNLKDCSPFKSQHREDLNEAAVRQWTWLVDRASEHEQQSRWEDALALYQQAANIDDRVASLHEGLGRVLAALNRWDEAQAAFERAVDEDVCPLRASTEIQSAVRRFCRRNDVSMIDFPDLLTAASLRDHNQPIPGRELFLDHVHPTIAGHRLLATALVEELIRQGTIVPSSAWPETAVAQAAARIESRIDPEFHGVALRNLAKVLAWAGKHHEAGRSAFAALEHIPDDPESTYLAACYLKMEGQTEQAVEYFRRALPHRPDDPEAHLLLADTLVEQGDLQEALVHYTRALQLRGGRDADVQQRMGTVLVKQTKYPQAVAQYRAALRDRPDDADLHYNLGVALSYMNDKLQARTHFTEALRLRPHFPEAHKNLGLLLAEAGRLDEAIEHYRQALQANPQDSETRRNLERALERTSTK
jgi:tetratricopeptide (TPR) repeat protein